MEVRINGRRYRAVPDALAPLLQAYAGLQGRAVGRAPDGALLVEGPLAGYRIALSGGEEGPEAKAVIGQTAALLALLGADLQLAGTTAATATVKIRIGSGPVVAPAGLFRGDDRVLARCLREGLHRHGGRPVREAPLLGAGWKPAAQGPAALVCLPPDAAPEPAALGLAAGLLRYAGLSPRQVDSLHLPDLLAEQEQEEAVPTERPHRVRRSVSAGPDPMLPTGDGQWISPRARDLEEEKQAVTPPARQT